MTRARPDSPPLFLLPGRPDFSMEREALLAGIWPVAGTDEAGRGPLAGPVVAAAVILDPQTIPDGLDDSKRLSAAHRETLFALILRDALAISVASSSAETIDRTDIRKASLDAMRRSVHGLSLAPKLVLADGRDVPPGMPCEGKAVVKGDQRSQSIAAASIVAKVIRDRMLTVCCEADTRYGFSAHAGYGTLRHRTAISHHGPVSRLHRLSFAPFRD